MSPEYTKIGSCPRCNGPELTAYMHERKEEGYAIPVLHCLNCGNYTFIGNPTSGTLAMPIGRVISVAERAMLVKR